MKSPRCVARMHQAHNLQAGLVLLRAPRAARAPLLANPLQFAEKSIDAWALFEGAKGHTPPQSRSKSRPSLVHMPVFAPQT